MCIKALLMKSDYRKIMPYHIDFVIPGFEKSYPRGIFKCLSFTDRSSEEWFLSFVNKVEEAIGELFLPIYRICMGEFLFTIGFHYPKLVIGEPLWRYYLRILRMAVLRFPLLFRKENLRDGGYIRGVEIYQSMDYKADEKEYLIDQYKKQLLSIVQNGILSILFTDRVTSRKQFNQQYFIPFYNWLKEASIKIHQGNYYPFYFTYALLTGPYRHRIYQGRRLLVITSYDAAKRDAIAKGLVREGVADVQFLPLSQGRSMYDMIDLSTVKRPIDLVLVGGGIGASNILCQLELLNTVAIDAGYIIECLANLERKKQRTFCWPDEERNGDYRPI